MNLPMTGGCLCGAVRYEITQPPKRMGICHCRSCQRATGSSYFPFIATHEDNLKISGDFKWFTLTGHTGQKISRGFCPNCGSTLFGRPDALPGCRTVSATSLDDLSQYKPEINVWTDEALEWVHMDPALTKFNKNPF